MAYEAGVSTTLADFLGDFFTFAVANGWTQDELNTGTGRAALHKGNVYVSMSWIVATPLHMSLHQALGFTPGNQPGTHPNDSGNGFNAGGISNSNILLERHVRDIDNDGLNYWFFEQDSGPPYIHVVLEVSSGIFRHFGFGELVKFAGTDWTGGEYLYGHAVTSAGPSATSNTVLLDGQFTDIGATNEFRAATIHIEGLAGQGGSEKWGQVWGSATSTGPVDTAGQPKKTVIGGARGSLAAHHFGNFAAGSTAGLVPMTPIGLFYKNSTNIYYLGYQPDVRTMNMREFAAGEEFVIGSDTWVVFPQGQKTSSAVANRTENSGIAYKKVTA